MEPRSCRRVHVDERLGAAAATSPTTSNLPKSPTSLRAILLRHRDAHASPNLDRDQPFSWSRCFISLISYFLLLSDVVRTGLGLRNIASSHGLGVVEPDTFFFLKPTSYLVQHLTQANATTSSSMAYWLYKYDTTSITMRAVAQHLNVSAWSPCVLYKYHCDETKGLTTRSVFTMVDSLVDAVANHQTRPQSKPLTLRTENVYKDRLHHYAFSIFFSRTIKRTSQAIYYQHHPAAASRPTSLCFGSGFAATRPYSWEESWTNWPRRDTRAAVSVWKQIPQRLAMLTALYPNHTIDSVLLDSTEDFTHGGITYQGRQYEDVVVFTRIRSCDGSNCTTIAVDDYRHEAAALVLNAESWYGVVATLRVVGQAYTWLRVLLLVVICTLARQQQRKSRGFVQEFTATIRTLFLIPSQVVIYGSSFPIALYTAAHLIDSPAMYELVAMRFVSTMGLFQWNVSDFIRHCGVSMRTVWILSLICHCLLAVSTRCVWSPTHGIPGVPEMLISIVASVTILAQYRSLALRDSRLLQIHEALPSQRMHQLRSQGHDNTRAILHNVLFGSTIDAQCLISAVLGLGGLAWIVWLVNRVSRKRFSYEVELSSRTLVPYSASTLWPKSRLVISWFGSIIVKDGSKTETFNRTATHAPGLQRSAFPHFRNASARLPRGLRGAPEKTLVMRNTETSRQAQRTMQSLDKRSREMESTIYLMNLAVMTDPISFLQLRFFSGCHVAVYESKLTRRCFVLPRVLHKLDTDMPVDWDELTLLAIVNTKELDWCDLLRCG